MDSQGSEGTAVPIPINRLVAILRPMPVANRAAFVVRADWRDNTSLEVSSDGLRVGGVAPFYMYM